MKLKLKEDPREWRKSVLLAALGLAVLSSVLCWRRILTLHTWAIALGVLAAVALAAWLRPPLFRGFYRFSARVGFFTSQAFARFLLVLIFALIVTPLGLLLRCFGKDSLRLKRSAQAQSYWQPARENSPLDRLF